MQEIFSLIIMGFMYGLLIFAIVLGLFTPIFLIKFIVDIFNSIRLFIIERRFQNEKN